MSVVMSILFVVGLFTVLGLITWAVVAFEMSRPGLSIPPSTDPSLHASREESRELVGQHAG